MSLFDDIGTVTVSCGGCRNNELCDKCRVETMRANGLPEEWADELKGLKKAWEYSAIYWKLKELQKRAMVNYEKTI